MENAQIDLFDVWMEGRPKWLQTAAAKILETRKRPTDDDIRALASLCYGEATKQAALEFSKIPAGSFSQELTAGKLMLEKLDKVNGVNAIRSDAVLSFGCANLCVVYGANGSGKSGFARLLKHACGARVKSELLQNVFSGISVNASAEICVNHDGEAIKHIWNGEVVPHLRHVHIFDTQTATNYINTKNQATYEPRRMLFITALIDVCDRVARELGERKTKLVKALPQIPADFAGTSSSNFFTSLKVTTTQVQIDQLCSSSKEEQEERIALEVSLKQTDIQARLTQLSQQKTRLSQLKEELHVLKVGYSDEKFGELIAARLDAIAKRKVASEDAEKVFQNASLEGVGQKSWRLLWDQARNYSETTAYSGQLFPVANDKARCVLCHQILDEDAKVRLSAFEAFVKSGLEAQAKEAEKCLEVLVKEIPGIPKKEDWSLKFENLKIEPAISEPTYESMLSRKQNAQTADCLSQLVTIDWTQIENALKTTEHILSAEATALRELQLEGKREKLEFNLKELKAKEWLAQQKSAVEVEVKRLMAVKQIESAESIAKTNSLTTKKNELALEELAQGYKERFEKELLVLGGKRIPVEPLPIPEGKGKVNFELILKGAKQKVSTHSVLSEGENRIVALSAFLADITSSTLPTPFVFDDPISSLDQDFEERVVARLIELAKTRQVIVFTHRLSLVTLLEEAVDRITKIAESMNIQPEVKIHLETLRRFGANIGLTSDFNLRENQPLTALNKIKNPIMPTLRKLYDAGDISEYESKAKGVCSDFRIVLERTVEKVLLSDVVVRFRRSLQTMGRIGALAKIEPTDCAFIDDLMTRYSCFEHSQSEELPVILPSPDELETDVTNVIEWIKEFKKRSVN